MTRIEWDVQTFALPPWNCYKPPLTAQMFMPGDDLPGSIRDVPTVAVFGVGDGWREGQWWVASFEIPEGVDLDEFKQACVDLAYARLGGVP